MDKVVEGDIVCCSPIQAMFDRHSKGTRHTLFLPEAMGNWHNATFTRLNRTGQSGRAL